MSVHNEIRTVTRRIAEFVAWDLHPISVVDGQGFTRLPLSKLGGWSYVYPAVVCLLHLGYPDVGNPHPLQP